MKFYETLEKMECLQGDTLDAFEITVDDIEDLTGYTMLLILEKSDTPGGIVLPKKCECTGSAFRVQLTSEDTKDLSGMYRFRFSMTAPSGLKYQKITGTLNVVPVSQEG